MGSANGQEQGATETRGVSGGEQGAAKAFSGAKAKARSAASEDADKTADEGGETVLPQVQGAADASESSDAGDADAAGAAIGPVSGRFLASSAVSLLGNSVAGVVLPLILLARTGDALAAGALAIICMVPQALAGVFGGALLDRFNRRDASVASDVISAASVAALPVIDATVGLSFGWFVLFGLLGAVGDVPGMTARDTLMPSVCQRDSVSMQRFVGVQQSVESLVTIAGPAAAALCMGLFGEVSALWITAAMSASAALVTCTIPRAVGVPPRRPDADAHLVRAALTSTKDGLRTLFLGSPMLRAVIVFEFLILIAMGGFQGLILPVHFTQTGQADQLGYVLSAMSVGILVGSVVYAQAADKISRRAWYVVSLVGMCVGMAGMGALPAYPALLASAAVLGLFAGPFSALLNFKMFDLIPNEVRGATLGTQNALMLVVAPVAVFGASVLVTLLGVATSAFALALVWGVFTIYALMAKAMRSL